MVGQVIAVAPERVQRDLAVRHARRGRIPLFAGAVLGVVPAHERLAGVGCARHLALVNLIMYRPGQRCAAAQCTAVGIKGDRTLLRSVHIERTGTTRAIEEAETGKGSRAGGNTSRANLLVVGRFVRVIVGADLLQLPLAVHKLERIGICIGVRINCTTAEERIYLTELVKRHAGSLRTDSRHIGQRRQILCCFALCAEALVGIGACLQQQITGGLADDLRGRRCDGLPCGAVIMIQTVFRAGPCVSCRKLRKGIEAVAMGAPCCAVPMVQILPDICAGQDQNRRAGAPRIRKVPFFFVVLYIHREAGVRDHGPCLLLAVPAIEELVAHGRTGSAVRIIAGRRNLIDFERNDLNCGNQAVVAIRTDRDHTVKCHLRDHSRQSIAYALEILCAGLIPCVKAVLTVEVRFQLLRHCIHARINVCNVGAGICGIALIVLIVLRRGQIDIMVVCCHIVVYRDLVGLFYWIQRTGRRAQRCAYLQCTGIWDRINRNICRIILASA